MKQFIRKLLLNNIVVNNVAIFFGLDKHLKSSNNYWKKYNILPNKTHQEVAGYSHIREVQEAVDKTHEILKLYTAKHLKKDAGVLDIGCGPGLYLMDFEKTIKLYGIDINDKMLELARKNNPNAIFYEGEFLSQKIDIKFNLIYSVGVMQYISRGEIIRFFDKIYDLLENNGIVFISYPHALSAIDLSFPDINYINYSPSFLNEILSKKFTLLQNKHVVDDRSITDYDKTPYKPSIASMDKIYKNSSILVAQKKN